MRHGENTGKDQQVPPSRNGNQGHGEKLLALQGHLPMGQGGNEIQEGEPWIRWPRHRGRHCRGGVIGVGPFLRLRLPDIRWSLGPTWLLRAMGQGLLDCLRRHFGKGAEWMFAVAAPRAARHCAFQCIEHCHTVSCLSVAFPGLALSPATLGNRLERLGTGRMAMVDFMREYIPAKKLPRNFRRDLDHLQFRQDDGCAARLQFPWLP